MIRNLQNANGCQEGNVAFRLVLVATMVLAIGLFEHARVSSRVDWLTRQGNSQATQDVHYTASGTLRENVAIHADDITVTSAGLVRTPDPALRMREENAIIFGSHHDAFAKRGFRTVDGRKI